MTSVLLDHPDTVADLLLEWLPRQRWFGGKARHLAAVRVVRATQWHDAGPDGPHLVHLVVAAEADGHNERYQLLVGLRRWLPERLEHARIGGVGDGFWAYDAVHDVEATAVVLGLLADGAEVDGVRFSPEPGIALDRELVGRPILAEQSNTSIVFGDEYILKLFRKLDTGVSPDLELHRALRAAGSAHIAEPFGAIEGSLDDAPVTYGLLQRFFANSADGWAMATTSVRDLIAEADLRADEVGGDFASEAHRLGQAVAAVHGDLSRMLGTDAVGVERLGDVVTAMHHRLDTVLGRADGLAPYEPAIRAVFDALREYGEPIEVQRIHGDLHLGQALRTLTGWVLIDFEGEPVRPVADRVAMFSPLRDVAGMLRSFDYAAHHLLVDHLTAEDGVDAQLEYRAVEWADRNRAAFCQGYATGGLDPDDHPALVRALELDKAVYEVAYEYDNRPTWVDIPLRSIARLAS